MAVMGPILGAVPSDAPSLRANSGGVIRSGPTLHSRSPSDNNGFARGVLRNQPAVPPSPAWQFSLPHATLRCKRRRALNGKDLTFDARFAGPGAGGNPEATRLFKRPQHRNQSRHG